MFGGMNRFTLPLLSILLLLSGFIFAQRAPFESEVRQISAKFDSLGWKSSGTVFTGSSTIRMWKSLGEEFPTENLLNTGFGGSKASDLERHLFPLVIKFEPSRVFIYEGDNDIWAGVPGQDILQSLEKIVTRIHLSNPSTEIFLIGAKPSPSRWEKRNEYQKFNQQLRDYCEAMEKVEFVDTWQALTTADGNPRPELYIQDQLHLNQEGYKIWTELFKPFF
jgi:lysophospholipase L1-like esterase